MDVFCLFTTGDFPGFAANSVWSGGRGRRLGPFGTERVQLGGASSASLPRLVERVASGAQSARSVRFAPPPAARPPRCYSSTGSEERSPSPPLPLLRSPLSAPALSVHGIEGKANGRSFPLPHHSFFVRMICVFCAVLSRRDEKM